MKYLDLTFPTPEHNLACDEALLDFCEEGYPSEILRFWEPNEHFVVLGYSRKNQADVHLSICHANRIPIFRRASGGGTVLQGPGCLNYSLILNMAKSKALRRIVDTNRYVMKRNQEALERLLKHPIEIKGDTDLAVGGLKFSGNAQRRKRRFMLFHGTFLINFDLRLVEKLLPVPARQPTYRSERAHLDFLVNLNLSGKQIKEALRIAWEAHEPLEQIPLDRIDGLVQERYKNLEWNFKF